MLLEVDICPCYMCIFLCNIPVNNSIKECKKAKLFLLSTYYFRCLDVIFLWPRSIEQFKII